VSQLSDRLMMLLDHSIRIGWALLPRAVTARCHDPGRDSGYEMMLCVRIIHKSLFPAKKWAQCE
jgi:hypothetical protein